MGTALGRSLFSFFIPGGLILLIAFLLTLGQLVESLPGLIRILPLVILVAGVLIGWRFNRSNLIFVLLWLAIADRALLHFAPGEAFSQGVGRTLYNSIAFLLPVNLVFYSMAKERGILNWHGLRRLSLIPAQAFAVAIISSYPQLGFAVYLEHSFLNWPLFNETPISQPALLAFGAAALLLMARCIQFRGVNDCACFWALFSGFFSLNVQKTGPVCTLYLTTAGIILLVSVIETSFGRAFHDELTGLPARRSLNETLFTLGSRYTVAMVDIDNFKNFNDSYGHDTGDQVLRMIASKLSHASGGGKAYRYGGEEFVIVFPGKSAEEAIPYLEALRKAVESADFFIRGGERRQKKGRITGKSRGKTTVTISIGVAERNDRSLNPHQVIRQADRALYRAKNKGRNQVSK